MTTVLFIWDVRPALRRYLEAGLDGVPVRLVFPEDTDEAALLEHAPEAEVIVGWRPSAALLDAAERLRLVVNPGAGVQHVVDRVRGLGAARGVRLVNSHGNAYFTAQHAVALLLALTNRVVVHDRWLRAGQWRRGDDDAASIPLRDRTVGLLGYGAVNRRVHRFLSGFDVRFAALRRRWPQAAQADGDRGDGRKRDVDENRPGEAAGLERFVAAELDAFLAAVDTLVIAVPQTEATTGLLGARELAHLGADGLLVNVARGPVVDEDALFEALTDGVIGGAALDVWYDYRPAADEDGRRYPYRRPFHTLERVVLSPHRAASPMDDLRRWDDVIDSIRRVATGVEPLRNEVDLAAGY